MNIVVLHVCRKDGSVYAAQSCHLHQLWLCAFRKVSMVLPDFECLPSVGCFSANRLKHRKLNVKEIKSLFLIV